jgi:murein DD-endopeptidase MepM/ murein hydrolase activator NlpD
VDFVNNKGSFKDDDSFGKKVKSFFKESGFYIAIVVGLCALAAGTVYFTTNQILTDPDENKAQEDSLTEEDRYSIIDDIGDYNFENPDQSSMIDENGSGYADEGPYAIDDLITHYDEEDETSTGDKDTHEDAYDVQKETDKPSEQQKQTDKSGQQDQSSSVSAPIENETGEISKDASQDVALAVVRPNFTAPVDGTIQTEYSMDKLVYSPTFNEWRTHSGVDIAAPRGAAVRSIGDGVILEVKNDPRYGFTIVVDHRNGYKSLYANLATDQTIKAGQEVKAGDPIGAVGATAIFESAEPTHLHFELYKEDKLVDPSAYIDFKTKASN